MFDTTSNVQTSFLMLFVSCLTLYNTDVKRNLSIGYNPPNSSLGYMNNSDIKMVLKYTRF